MSNTIELLKYFYKIDREFMESMNQDERYEYVYNSDEYKLINQVEYEFGSLYIPEFFMKHNGELIKSYDYWFKIFLDYKAYKESPSEYYHRIKALGYQKQKWIKLYHRVEITKLLKGEPTDAFNFKFVKHPAMQGNESLNVDEVKAPEMKQYSKSDFQKVFKSTADSIALIEPYDYTADPGWAELSKKLIKINKSKNNDN